MLESISVHQYLGDISPSKLEKIRSHLSIVLCSVEMGHPTETNTTEGINGHGFSSKVFECLEHFSETVWQI